jgi:hypothetical protein
MIGLEVGERGKIQVEDIDAIILVVTGKGISALVILRGGDLDHTLRVRGYLPKEDREEQAYIFHATKGKPPGRTEQ